MLRLQHMDFGTYNSAHNCLHPSFHRELTLRSSPEDYLIYQPPNYPAEEQFIISTSQRREPQLREDDFDTRAHICQVAELGKI